jgi:type VI secretion system protein VasD
VANRSRWRAQTLLLLAVSLIPSGCISFGSGEPPTANITIEGAKTLNTTAEGKSTPVVVQLFALKAKSGFSKADFFGLYDSPGATLGKDLVASEKVTVRPGATTTRTWTLDQGEQFVGAIAAFRNIDSAVWRDVAEVDRDQSASAFTVGVGEGEIEVARP